MSETAAFDVLAADYDVSFSQSLTGQAQRNASRYWLQAFLKGKGSLRILEINCGTGDDAWWLASLGHTVTATDQSPAMIQQAMSKSFEIGHDDEQLAEAKPQSLKNAPVNVGTTSLSTLTEPEFAVCSFDELGQRFAGQQFDLVFSNFAGLNCISPSQLRELGTALQSLLDTNGHMAAVIFGKYCWWETCYYLLKADLRQAFRRWSGKPAQAQLSDGVSVPIYYYSVKSFVNYLPSFSLQDKKPVGLFVPPSYLEPPMRRHPSIFSGLARMERWLRRLPLCSALADHTYLLLKKRTA